MVLTNCFISAILFASVFISTIHGLPEVIRIGQRIAAQVGTRNVTFIKNTIFYPFSGGLFDGSDPMPESAFRQSLERVNENGKFLPSSNLMSSVERIPPNDSYFASKRGSISGTFFSSSFSLYSP